MPAVGVELTRTEPSQVPWYKGRKISSVDDLDAPAGQAALLYALAGNSGRVRREVDRRLAAADRRPALDGTVAAGERQLAPQAAGGVLGVEALAGGVLGVGRRGLAPQAAGGVPGPGRAARTAGRPDPRPLPVRSRR